MFDFRICSIFQFQNLNFTDLERTNKNDSSEQSCKDLQSGISTIDDNSCEWGILVENHIKDEGKVKNRVAKVERKTIFIKREDLDKRFLNIHNEYNNQKS